MSIAKNRRTASPFITNGLDDSFNPDFALPDVKEEIFSVDFPDAFTAKILMDRWQNTANLLAIIYAHGIVPYGEGKFRYTVQVYGMADDMERFTDFIDESLNLIDGTKIQ